MLQWPLILVKVQPHQRVQVTKRDTGIFTFRPKKKFEPGTLRYSLHKQAQASLNSGINLRDVVKLPPGEDLNDWLAVHVVDFFNRINLIYGTITDFCLPETCPTMSGGPKFEYLWADGNKYKKPVSLPAPQYISLLMDWIEAQINNEDIFPVKVEISTKTKTSSIKEKFWNFKKANWNLYQKNTNEDFRKAPTRIKDLEQNWISFKNTIIKAAKVSIPREVPFPKNFIPNCKKILTRLFRVFVHVYIHHFDRLVSIGAEAHVNTCYKHFYYFITEFDLVSQKELEPLIKRERKETKRLHPP
ncbi:MOB3B, partial [Cordylochernes scorpioides]